MPKLSNLLAEKTKGEIQVGGTTLPFTYWAMWRERFTEDEWKELWTVGGRDQYKRLLPRVLISWDLESDDGQPIPITAEAFDANEVPDDLLATYWRRIAAGDLSGKVTATPSPGG